MQYAVFTEAPTCLTTAMKISAAVTPKISARFPLFFADLIFVQTEQHREQRTSLGKDFRGGDAPAGFAGFRDTDTVDTGRRDPSIFDFNVGPNSQ